MGLFAAALLEDKDPSELHEIINRLNVNENGIVYEAVIFKDGKLLKETTAGAGRANAIQAQSIMRESDERERELKQQVLFQLRRFGAKDIDTSYIGPAS